MKRWPSYIAKYFVRIVNSEIQFICHNPVFLATAAGHIICYRAAKTLRQHLKFRFNIGMFVSVDAKLVTPTYIHMDGASLPSALAIGK